MQKRDSETVGHFLAALSLAIFALIFWIIGLIFYLKKRVDFMATPAISRSHNEGCSLWSFYDTNDIWAFCSSYGLFYQFMSIMFYKMI